MNKVLTIYYILYSVNVDHPSSCYGFDAPGGGTGAGFGTGNAGLFGASASGVGLSSAYNGGSGSGSGSGQAISGGLFGGQYASVLFKVVAYE
ncbi:hypothetical protein DAPPUDRAFT_264561 [Daphnia pulex]|uniref:Uncharacterized protein n=1 Tax=Daphnia pulex TaxID=6669 RepID=E9HRU7_DAPPU|nr:hypothetical protein DAPPUDRAFT_264561 [Daphnia pulex]|eukprot:EFX65535.1 hypothetical protein DAPPUDRAFT_264561 [Daphnia pulex]